MIGDGVNDVLSLKKANLGIAMQSGSQAARGVADIVLTDDSFAALAPAVEEGQRILNGMQDILRLFLTRITTVGLLIVTSLVIGLFPIDLRNGSALTLFTVGIPTAMLAVWAQPGQRPHESLGRTLARFVVPAAALSSLVGLAVLYGTLFLEVGLRRSIGGTVDAAELDARGQGRPVQPHLVPRLRRPHARRVRRAADRGSSRSSSRGRRTAAPAIMALVLAVAYVVLLVVPAGRAIFALQPLGPPGAGDRGRRGRRLGRAAGAHLALPPRGAVPGHLSGGRWRGSRGAGTWPETGCAATRESRPAAPARSG